MSAHALPRPGPRWGDTPVKPEHQPRPDDGAGLRLSAWVPPSHQVWWHRSWLRQVAASQARWHALAPSTPEWALAHRNLVERLRTQGFEPTTLADGVGAVCAAVQHRMGINLSASQRLAALHLLRQHMVELPTGEGKTWSMACAATLAAMAGVPVHVITANPYLAQRDADSTRWLSDLMGVKVKHVATDLTEAERRIAHQADIVYGTVRDFAFDHMRDLLRAPQGGTPVLRGLCLALLDEADCLLIDEAAVPLVIATTIHQTPAQRSQQRAVWWQAWTLSGELRMPQHAQEGRDGKMALTPMGRDHLQTLTQGMGGVWSRERIREQLLSMALTARHQLQRDQHYLLRDDKVILLDTLTGRAALGRVMGQGLQHLVEIKEGVPLSAPTRTQASLTVTRFFQRYWRLGGISATLKEARGELKAQHRLPVVCLPPRMPSQRQRWPLRCFDHPEARWAWVSARAAQLQSQGRPVLVGTDTMDDAQALSAALSSAGVRHVVLTAHQDAHEAEIIARAGVAGAVTVATRLAGRGTDIHLDAHALAAGGLHVIHCQRNESARMDRQLWGRCARQGQPGSTETLLCTGNSREHSKTRADKLVTSIGKRWPLPGWWTLGWHAAAVHWRQWLQGQRQSRARQRLQDQDRPWDPPKQHARTMR